MLFKAHHHWLFQRISAVFLVFLYPLLLFWFYRQRSLDYDELIVVLQGSYAMTLIAVSILVSVYHAALGLQVIIDDYVSTSCKNVLLTAMKCFALILCLLAFFFLFKIKTLEISL
ncbi:MAG: succinate dehydrogenase, hydrophobic membrane anchor protein [Alphaproteobacteria bacterium]|nr:succinate dehydrogenase, hydrophobic membrane anchor protein [Alphaproteobacteria bacterium]